MDDERWLGRGAGVARVLGDHAVAGGPVLHQRDSHLVGEIESVQRVDDVGRYGAIVGAAE